MPHALSPGKSFAKSRRETFATPFLTSGRATQFHVASLWHFRRPSDDARLQTLLKHAGQNPVGDSGLIFPVRRITAEEAFLGQQPPHL
jgi:hypothetical protein